ncbi:MAG: zinc-dependent alcohol dehydrogenase [Myxococcaceae bacterium]
MKAVVFHGIGDIRLDEVPEPTIQQPTDAIVRLTASAICGTDLHLVRGTVGPMRPGTVLGHEGVGVVEELGGDVRNLKVGDRVVICSTIACGKCVYCRAGYYSQCDDANPHGKLAGTAYFGGPEASGAFHGTQAERVRVPFAHVGLVKVPDVVSDDQAILISDVFPTGYFAAKLAEVGAGDAVVVYGCGPVGQFSIAAAKLLGAGRVFAVDAVASRLDMARAQGAEVVDFNREDPVEVIRELTGGIGVDRAIDAVGVDAMAPSSGPAARKVDRKEMAREVEEIAPGALKKGDWRPGDGPSQTLIWAVDSLDKAGTLAIVGVYPTTARTFPIGMAMNKNLTLKMGNCNHRKYVPRLLELVRSGAVDPSEVLTQHHPMTSALDAYLAFDHREPGWMKVELQPLH